MEELYSCIIIIDILDLIKTNQRNIDMFFGGKTEMIDPITNEVIEIFKTKEEALRYLGKRKSGTHIKNAIRKNKLAYGYRWKEVIS